MVSSRSLVVRGIRWVAILLLVGGLTGSILFHFAFGLYRIAELGPLYLQCLVIGFTYTVIMTAFLKGMAHGMRGRIPLQSRWSVAAHVAIQSLGTVASFGIATAVVWLLLGDARPLDDDLLLVVAAVSFVTALVWNAFAYMRAFYQRLRKAESAAHEARLQALRAQINPHFLFNAFNSITALVHTKPEQAQSVVLNLADLFRYTLKVSQTDHTTLGDELRAARTYLSIQEVRFGDRLTVNVDVPQSLLSARLPGMTIQPLVENAVKHGACKTLAPCTIHVHARRSSDYIHLRITDTGPGFDTTDPQTVLKNGTGLANLSERLSLFFKGRADLQLLPHGVELCMPLVDTPSES